MKRILQFLFMLTVCISAYSQGATFNMVETSYVTTTISQVVVFDDTMRSGGTLNFTVQAHNGGGNASANGANNDTANLKILYYNASGALLYTASTAYNKNLPIPNGYHGVDPTVPWTTLSLSAANCGGSCSTVAYVKVQMVGIDGAYWAGDYGPYYQQPVLTFNGGGNILYNPEFGVAPNGTLVQGWTASPNWGVCQGAYGGSNPCTTNYAGVTANMNNGGYSATGGSTAAAPGGYGTPPVTVTSTSVSYTTRQVVNGNITTNYQTPVTTTNYSDGTHTTTTGTETLYSTVAYSYTERTSVNGATTTTYRTDVTTITYSNGTVTTTTGQEYVYSVYVDPNYTYPSYVTVGSGTTGDMVFGSAGPLTTDQQTKVDTWANKVIQDGNRIYIQQIGGESNTVTMDQDGNKNLIRLQLNGTNNTIKANQGVQGIGQNEMKLSFEGNNNVVNLNQSRDTLGNAVGTNGHYLDATIAGWGNVLTVQQSNNGGVGGHYNETSITGNGNSVLAKQTDNGNKIMFVNVNGAINTVDVTQKGTGQHKADLTLTGDRNSATVLQEGTTANNATLNLTNAGGPASVIVNQAGGQNVSVTTTCATAGGCAPISVRQGY